MQLCSSLTQALCNFVWLTAVLCQHLNVSAARELQAAHHQKTSTHAGRTRAQSQPSRLGTDKQQPQTVPGVYPMCSNAYAVVHHPSMPNSESSWGRYLPVSIAGVTDPAGQHIVVAISKIKQNEHAYNQHLHDSCPDAQINGLNSLFVRYESSEAGDAGSMHRGRTYLISFVARNEAGFSCDGVVEVCVPSGGHMDCLVTVSDIFYDSTVCMPSKETLLLSMD